MSEDAASSLLLSLREFFLHCPLLLPGAFSLQRLDSLFPSGALLPQEERLQARYLDGERILRFDFLLCTRESHTACTADTLESFARFDALIRWLEKQNRRRFLPFLSGGRQPLSLQPMGQACAGESDEDRIAWQLRCRLTYLQAAD